jgi:protein SCO1/2
MTKSPARLAIVGWAAGALLLCGSAFMLLGHGTPPRTVGGHYSLTAPDGSAVSEQTFRGKYVLIYFGYTSCTDVCPATLNTLAAALGRLGNKGAALQPLFITLDPAHDTQAVLRRYTASFTPALLGLTGTPAALTAVAAAFHVYSADAGHGRIDHSSVLYLMDRDGGFLAPIRAEASADAMAREILRFLV